MKLTKFIAVSSTSAVAAPATFMMGSLLWGVTGICGEAYQAEDAWNTRDPVRVSLAYTEDSVWRNCSEFFAGRQAIVEFLTRKWARENGYRLIKELWAFTHNHIAVRFQYEWHDDSGQWFRTYGNEQWEFSETGHMRRREASINDVPIAESDRKFHWPQRPRPTDHPGLSELGM